MDIYVYLDLTFVQSRFTTSVWVIQDQKTHDTQSLVQKSLFWLLQHNINILKCICDPSVLIISSALTLSKEATWTTLSVENCSVGKISNYICLKQPETKG